MPRIAPLSFVLAALLPVACLPETTPPDREAEAGDAPADLELVDVTEVGGWEKEEAWAVGPERELEEVVSRVAMMIDLSRVDAHTPAVQARGRHADGAWTAWTTAEETWREDELGVLVADLPEGLEAVQLRYPTEALEELASFRWVALTPPATDEEADDDVGLATGETTQPLSSTLSSIGVISRAGWGARSPACSTSESSKWRMTVHHTVTHTDNPAARVRQVQSFHIDGRGWCDIAYHFMVAPDGTMYEARPINVRGGHTYNGNSGNLGIAYLGCFQPGSCGGITTPAAPTEISLNKGAELIAVLADVFDIDVSSSTLKGHRDHRQTTCPGSELYAELGRLRAGTPAPADNGTPPSWPSNASIWGQNAHGGTVTIRWNAPSDDVGTDRYAVVVGGQLKVVNSPQVTVSGLRPYSSYDVNVVAADAVGNRSAPLLGVVETGGFVDLGGSSFTSAIEWIAQEAITLGCNPPTNDRYCPGDGVTRGQMAAFLTRALNLPPGPDAFIDDNGTTFEAANNALAAAGITHGCNPPTNNRFCPANVVTRGQMAAFLTRALDLPSGPDVFVDDNGNTFENAINALAAANITHGCNPPANDRFCPGDDVTREQMAAFLKRALD